MMNLDAPTNLIHPQTHLKYWKASELRNWLLYYFLPLLLQYQPSLYWHHYALLACSIHILLGDRITRAQIETVENMLHDLCQLFPELYDERHCTALTTCTYFHIYVNM